MNFTAWLEKCRDILWVGVPPYAQINYVTNYMRKRSIIYVDPHYLDEVDRLALHGAAIILAPTKRIAQLLGRRWKLPNVLHCPYDAGIVPQGRMGYRSKLIRVAIPLIDEFAGYAELPLLYHIQAALATTPNITVRFLVSSSRILGSAKKRLAAFRRLNPERFEVVKVKPYDQWAEQLLDVDLLLWPAVYGGIGCYIYTAGALGIPTLSFAVPPFDEQVDAFGGYTVKAAFRTEDKMRWYAKADYAALVTQLEQIAQNPAALRERSALCAKARTTIEYSFDSVLGAVAAGWEI